MFVQTEIVLDTKNLAFGLKPPQKVQIQLVAYEDLVGSTPTFNISNVSGPFSASIDNGALFPILNLVLDQLPSEINLGESYSITISGNGGSYVMPVKFVYAEDYSTIRWVMSDKETTAGSAYMFKELIHGARILSSDLNTRFKMLIEYAAQTYTKLTDFIDSFETKRKLRDIIDTAVNAGVFPRNCSGTVIRDTNGNVVQIDLVYNDKMTDRFTRILFEYAPQTIIFDFSSNPAPFNKAPFGVQKPLMNSIDVFRIGVQGGNRRYRIAKVTFSRATQQYTSLSGCIVTAPMVSGWTVNEQ